MEKIEQVAYRLRLDKFSGSPVVKLISGKTNLSPIIVTFAIFCVITMFLTLTRFGRTIFETVILYIYPAIKTFDASKTMKSNDDHRWMTYWIIFGLIYGANAVLPELFDWIPLWHVARMALLCYLINPRYQLNDLIFRLGIRNFVFWFDLKMHEFLERHGIIEKKRHRSRSRNTNAVKGDLFK